MLLDEEGAEALVADIGGDNRRIVSASGGLDRFVIEVTREYLQRRRRIQRAGVLDQKHRE